MNNNGTIETSDPNNSEIIQQNNYYPFGLEFQGTNYHITPQENQYKYNGKELQSDFGLNWYDYGFRNYDPQIGTWHVIDPMAESAPDWTPYRYAFNNPVIFSDFMGLWEKDGDGNMKTNDPSEISRLYSFLVYDPNASVESIGKFVDAESKQEGSGRTSDGQPVLSAALAETDKNGTFNLSSQSTSKIHSEVDAIRNGNQGWGETHNGIGQPGLGESLIPIWGSGRAAIDHFQNGNIWRGLAYSALAVSDVFLVKAIAAAAAKGAVTAAAKFATRQAVKNPSLSIKEAAAMANPRVARLMMGKGVDRAFRNYANRNLILKPAQRIGLIEINPMNKGADIIGKGFLKGIWWDVTTIGQWERHVSKYGSGGVALIW